MSNGCGNSDYGNWGAQPENNNKSNSGKTLLWVIVLVFMAVIGYFIYTAKASLDSLPSEVLMEDKAKILELEKRVRDLELEKALCEKKYEELKLARQQALETSPESQEIDGSPDDENEVVKDDDVKDNPIKPLDVPAKDYNLTPQDVRTVMTNSASEFRSCARDSAKKGSMNVKFTIKPDGSVTKEKCASPGFDKKTEECILKLVSNLKFPAHKGGDIPVTYPILIQ